MRHTTPETIPTPSRHGRGDGAERIPTSPTVRQVRAARADVVSEAGCARSLVAGVGRCERFAPGHKTRTCTSWVSRAMLLDYEIETAAGASAETRRGKVANVDGVGSDPPRSLLRGGGQCTSPYASRLNSGCSGGIG